MSGWCSICQLPLCRQDAPGPKKHQIISYSVSLRIGLSFTAGIFLWKADTTWTIVPSRNDDSKNESRKRKTETVRLETGWEGRWQVASLNTRWMGVASKNKKKKRKELSKRERWRNSDATELQKRICTESQKQTFPFRAATTKKTSHVPHIVIFSSALSHKNCAVLPVHDQAYPIHFQLGLGLAKGCVHFMKANVSVNSVKKFADLINTISGPY